MDSKTKFCDGKCEWAARNYPALFPIDELISEMQKSVSTVSKSVLCVGCGDRIERRGNMKNARCFPCKIKKRNLFSMEFRKKQRTSSA